MIGKSRYPYLNLLLCRSFVFRRRYLRNRFACWRFFSGQGLRFFPRFGGGQGFFRRSRFLARRTGREQ
ncbi:MAG: hypothetical protein A3K09_07615 [Nitrospinae bacterium RIFCSPLOWO2_12_FULL_47_7]|nr:MAG: hypothetical protein A3K09_07615 [Nitrospinae bacterium RIFCSPLOWO2_12_FULL_47_7]